MDVSFNPNEIANAVIYGLSFIIGMKIYSKARFGYLTAKSNNEHIQERTDAEIRILNANAEVKAKEREEEAKLMNSPNYPIRARADLAKEYLERRQERAKGLDGTTLAYATYEEQLDAELGTLEQFLENATPQSK